jgi:hypothetical protein
MKVDKISIRHSPPPLHTNIQAPENPVTPVNTTSTDVDSSDSRYVPTSASRNTRIMMPYHYNTYNMYPTNKYRLSHWTLAAQTGIDFL